MNYFGDHEMKKITTILLILIVSLVFTGVVLASDNSIKVVSDTSVMVYGPIDEYKSLGDPAWGVSAPAMGTWVHPVWSSWFPFEFPGASWISTSYLIGEDGGSVGDDSWRLFSKTVDLCQGAYNIMGTITSKADNAEEVYVNGVFQYYEGELIPGTGKMGDYKPAPTLAFIADPADTLTLDFIIRNYAGSSDPYGNPTGLIFSAEVNYDCPLYVDIDVKPGSFPSCFRNDGSGVIPVAIFGSEELTVTDINPNSVKLDGLKVVSKNKSNRLMVAYEDINEDGYMDMLVKIEDVEGTYSPGMGWAYLTGELDNGRHIMGTGDICVRK
jgi:hypothetical protein